MNMNLHTTAMLVAAHLLCASATAGLNISERSLKIAVTADADPSIRGAAQKVLASTSEHPLLKILCGSTVPTQLHRTDALLAGPIDERAYDHLILIGLPEDRMIERAWQSQAKRIENGLYVFGFGHLHGDIGFIESDRSPFLHSRQIKSAPYETQVIVLTGNTPAGVALAVERFLDTQVINGVVADRGWSRGQANLLQRDPLVTRPEIPAAAPKNAGGYTRIGWTQASEDEYRAVLADTGVKPLEIQRWKYYRPGVWDTPLPGAAFKDAKVAWDLYLAGLNRRAFGNTLWLARFDSPPQAAEAMKRIQPTIEKVGQREHSGAKPPQVQIWQKGDTVVLSTLPEETNQLIREN